MLRLLQALSQIVSFLLSILDSVVHQLLLLLLELVLPLKSPSELKETFILGLLIVGALNATNDSLDVTKAGTLKLALNVILLFDECETLFFHPLGFLAKFSFLASQLA